MMYLVQNQPKPAPANWSIRWRDSTGQCELLLTGRTHEEAMQIARGMGMPKPRWWQFWRRPTVVGY